MGLGRRDNQGAGRIRRFSRAPRLSQTDHQTQSSHHSHALGRPLSDRDTRTRKTLFIRFSVNNGGTGEGARYWAPTGRISTVESCIHPLSSSPMTMRTPRRMISCLPSYQRTIIPVSRSTGDT